jgi:glutamate-1-semialdehyde 2,1-aminomutase
MGVIPPVPGFLETIRRLTAERGALFICDEVITGFRVAVGGAQSLYDLDPDLTTLGKIVGGGLPIGAYGGKTAIMQDIAPAGPVYQAGTLSGNPLATAAGIASVARLREQDFYKKLERATQRLANGLREALRQADMPGQVNAVTGMLTLFFTDTAVSTLDDAQTANTERYACFFHAMLDRGIYLPPSQFEAWMLSASHTREIIDQTIEAAADVLCRLESPSQ